MAPRWVGHRPLGKEIDVFLKTIFSHGPRSTDACFIHVSFFVSFSTMFLNNFVENGNSVAFL